ncbi:MAG: hypothetical protein AAGI06_17405 [Pseudomonadota bacterium]
MAERCHFVSCHTSVSFGDLCAQNDNRDGKGDLAGRIFIRRLTVGGALAAITCSTVNSYKGLVAKVPGFEGGVYTWAPTHVTYGPNNRSAMLRMPQNRFCIENRATDMCMNAYLAMACTTAATVEGLGQKTDPGPALGKDLYLMSEAEFDETGVQRLPRTLEEATNLLEGDELLKAAIGDQMHNSFIQYKRDEWERYSVSISQWEIEEYLRYF